MGRADKGDKDAANLLRILTPVYKFRACRDNIPVASAALEVKGGLGYIEEWVTARLVRDAQIGTLWEGTSNINALDVVQRAVGKSGGHKTLSAALKAKYEPSGALPGQYKGLLGATLDRVERFVEAVAAGSEAGKALPPRRRRPLSRHDRGAAGLGRRHPRRRRWRRPPPPVVAFGHRTPPRATRPAIPRRVGLGRRSHKPPPRRCARASREGGGVGGLTSFRRPERSAEGAQSRDLFSGAQCVETKRGPSTARLRRFAQGDGSFAFGHPLPLEHFIRVLAQQRFAIDWA